MFMFGSLQIQILIQLYVTYFSYYIEKNNIKAKYVFYVHVICQLKKSDFCIRLKHAFYGIDMIFQMYCTDLLHLLQFGCSF